MAGFRRPRYLACFYCGKRTSTLNDGKVRQFECRNCDATNYLDEDGEVTDPPVATTTSARATPHYARAPEPFPGVSSNDADTSESVFCATCLKNQHLFIASLAQYFPDDPNHPDTPELERRYFRFRQGLEQRYPQVCAQCEPAVMARINQAAYTAKTDHLRRMVNYSRQVRLARPSYLDTAHALGRWMWWSSLAFQLLWQGSVLAAAISGPPVDANEEAGFSDDRMDDDDGTFASAAALGPLQPIVCFLLAHAGRLQSLCVAATVAGCWWNPYFVQTVRGFTKPYLGIPAWYAYMASILVVRLVLVKVAGGKVALVPATLGMHAFATLFILYVYGAASRVIRKDMRPLFGKLPDTPLASPPRPRTAEQRRDERRRDLETLSDVLDEISASTPARPINYSADPFNSRDAPSSGWPPQNGRASETWGGRTPERKTSDFAFSTLQLDDPAVPSFPQNTEPSYGDEMDWVPTQATQLLPSPHRAFRTYDAAGFSAPTAPFTGAFNRQPADDGGHGPFWYKVPPAPTSIAQRVLNRPNAPRLRPSPAEEYEATQEDRVPTSALFGRDASSGLSGLGLGASQPTAAASSVEFAPPHFFAETMRRGGGHEDDPGNQLSDLFSQSFSLGSGGGEERQDGKDDSRPGQRRRRQHDAPTVNRGAPSMARRLVWLVAVAASAAFLYGVQAAEDDVDDDSTWLSAQLQSARPYAHVAALSAAGACAVLAASLTSESLWRWRSAAVVRQRQRQRTDGAVVVLPSVVQPAMGVLLGAATMVLAVWLALQGGAVGSASGAQRAETLSMWADEEEDGVATTTLPWPYWQLALLHGSVAVHQVWNMAL